MCIIIFISARGGTPSAFGCRCSFLLHKCGETLPWQLRWDRLQFELLRWILKIVRYFLLGVEDAHIVGTGSLLRCFISSQPYLSFLRCGSNLCDPFIKLWAMADSPKRWWFASANTTTAIVRVPWRRCFVQVYVPILKCITTARVFAAPRW